MLLAYAVLSGFIWVTLQIRLAFNPSGIGLQSAPPGDAETWAWSSGWLAYGLILMVLGPVRASRFLRALALGVIALVCAKVFGFDMAALTGLWRVLSFLGLGLGLIGLGALHRRLLRPEVEAG